MDMTAKSQSHLLRSFLHVVLLGVILAGCASSHATRGDELAEAGNWDEAVLAYSEALRDDP